MTEIYKFVILDGMKGNYTTEFARYIKKHDLVKTVVRSGKSDGGLIVWDTTNEALFEHFREIGYVLSLAAMKNSIKQNKLLIKRETELVTKQKLIEEERLKSSLPDEKYADLFHVTENGNIVFHRTEIAKYLTEKYHARIIVEKEYMFLYNYDYNIYELDYGTTFETELNTMFGDIINTTEVREIMHKIWNYKDRQVKESSLSWNNDRYINFVNGVLDMETMELDGHDPDKYYFQSIISHIYNPDAQCPNILGMFERIFGIEEVENQLEWVGFCLTPGYRFKMIMFYNGPSDAGKSSYFNLLTHIVDESNVVHISPQDISGNYNIAKLHGKMINIAADIGSGKVKNFNLLRELSGGDRMTMREIRQAPVEFTNFAKLMFGCNDIPDFDNVQATYNRVRIVDCTRVFTNKEIAAFDPSIYRTDDEISGLINEGLRAYKNTLERGGFIKDDAETTAYKHELKMHSVTLWARDKLEWVNDNEGSMFMRELELNYRNWCRSNGIHTDYTGKGFTRKFHIEFRDEWYTNERRVGGRGREQTQVLGVKLKDDEKSRDNLRPENGSSDADLI